MAVAIIATLLVDDLNNILLIVAGIVIGTVIGVPAARQVKMTAMPQMVALFNGVGGGAVALIAWTEFRHTGGFAEVPTYVAIFSVFAAIVGSVSFWGSNIAFAKLQELISGKPVTIGALQTPVNALLGLIAIGCGVAIVAGEHAELLMILLLVAAALLGNLLVLPIGGADMPVVISLLNAFTGLSAAAAGVALDNTALIVAGMIVGASGTLLTQQMAVAMNRTITSVIAGGFGGAVELPAARAAPRAARCGPRARRTWRSRWPTPARSSSSRATAWRSPRPSTPSARWPSSWRPRAWTSSTRSTPSPGGCRAT
jgi:NAD(P) transhydrogenase subunit beta